MSRVLVTGASGRVGRAIAARLAKRHEVLGLDLVPGPFTSHLGDLCEPALLEQACAGVQAVVHTAALHAPHVGKRPDSEFRRVNVDGTRRLLDACLARGVRRLVYTGSTSTYGHALVPRDRAIWVTESLRPQPRDIYDQTKLEAEHACASAVGAGLSAVCLRIARCIPEGAAAVACYRLYRGVARADVAQAHELAIAASAPGWEVFNIGASTPFLESDVVRLYGDAAAVIGERLQWAPAQFLRRGWKLPPVIDRVYVSDLARDRLGYRPVHDLARYLGLATSGPGGRH